MVDDKLNPQPLQPEETPPELVVPEQPISPLPTDLPPSVPDHKTKYFIVGGAVLFFIIVFGLILSLVFGRSKKLESVSLNYWGLWEEKEIIQPLIDEYQKKNPHVKIVYTKMVPQDYRDKVITRGKAGQGPDIFRFHNTWVPQIRDIATSIPSSVMTPDQFRKTFYSIHAKDLQIDGKYYGIPLMIDGLVLAYNDELFRKAGINRPPVSWEDIIEDVRKLTVKNTSGQIVTSGIALGTANNIEHFSDIFGLFLAQNGGDLKKLDQPEAEGALESYRTFAEGDVAFWDETMPNSSTAFAQEKVAMIIVPSWQIVNIKNINPTLQLKVVPVPVIPGSHPLSIATYWSEGISRYSKHQLEGWKFLKYLSEKETMTKAYELQSKTRLFGSAYSRVDLGSLLAQNEYLGAVIRQAQGEGTYVSLPLISRTYDNGLNDRIIAYIENAINQTIQGISYRQAMLTAKEGIDQIFSDFQIK